MSAGSRVVERVMIMGGSGVGKSHLALRLAAISGLPRYHMDQLSWLPGFVHRPTAELDRLTSEIHATDHWIIEGGHYETSHDRAKRADLLLVLAPCRLVQVMQIVLRSWRYSRKIRPGMAEGCPQRFGPQTLSAVDYALRSNSFHLERAQEVMNASPRLTVRKLGSRREIDRFILGCSRVAGRRGFVIDGQTGAPVQHCA
ncbi:MAG: DNA topology modulation protein FlaR [Pseudomonadota bacterium]|nr:DNA topology modulation protein FlaR [Pseudomonadota bacterium]